MDPVQQSLLMAASSEIPNLSPKAGRGSREFAAALSRHAEAAEHSELMPPTPVTVDAPALTVRTGEASPDGEGQEDGADALRLLASHPVRRLATLLTSALCMNQRMRCPTALQQGEERR